MTIALPDIESLVNPVRRIARRASAAILEYYKTDLRIDRKDDYSPITEADRAADGIIVSALEALTPDIPVVSEERVQSNQLAAVQAAGCFWLVDPLDGTKEFISKRDDFTVSIGLIQGDRPIFGVLSVPVQDTIYSAAGPGKASRQVGDGPVEPIAARVAPANGSVVATSRSHANSDNLDVFLEGEVVAKRIIAGSALKFSLIAEGRADIYPRLGQTMEWDTAAGQAIVEAAGGAVHTLDGQPFRYGKPYFRNKGFVARGLPG